MSFIFGVDDGPMAIAEHLEIETKFDVDNALGMPVLTRLPGVVVQFHGLDGHDLRVVAPDAGLA